MVGMISMKLPSEKYNTQNWKSVCELGKNEGFDVIIAGSTIVYNWESRIDRAGSNKQFVSCNILAKISTIR